MELYTSLVRLKQAMNGGTLPPMTPFTALALEVVDPTFLRRVGGMGGLDEDEALGLRCPIKGCGVWRHALYTHIRFAHPEIGCDGLRRALSIPLTATLVSSKLRPAIAARGRLPRASLDTLKEMAACGRVRAHARRRRGTTTIGERNLRNSCPAQLSHRIIDLHNRLGRSPTSNEFASEYGFGLRDLVRVTFGSWENALALVGLDAVRRKARPFRSSQLDVLPALSAWYHEHGTLPSRAAVESGRQTPVLPCRKTIQRALNARSWAEAMQRAASILNIYGGRYGLPQRKEPAA